MAKRRKRKITPEDLCRLHYLSGPQISPDGRTIVFVHRQVGNKNDYVVNLWTVGTDGGAPRPFTGGGADGHPHWSPDGTRIAFVRGRAHEPQQIHTIPAAGGEAAPLTRLPEGKIRDFRWSPDGRRLALAFREQDPEWTKEAKKARAERGLSEPPRVLDDWWYRLDGDGYFNAQRYALYLVDAGTGEHRRVFGRDTLGLFTYDFSPDARRLVVCANVHPKAMIRPHETGLFRLDVKTGKARRLPGLPDGPKDGVRWSPDGRRIAWAGRPGLDDVYSVENLELFVGDASRGGARSLSAKEDYCLLATTIDDLSEPAFGPNLRWSPDGKRIFLSLGWHGETHVASVPARGGRIAFHTSGAAVHAMGNLSADGRRMALAVSSATSPPEIAVAAVRGGAFRVRRLTALNAPLLREIELARPRSHWVRAKDGTRVQVWSMRPPGPGRGRKAPAVLEIHGGPHAQYGVGFFHEFQVLAANGYAVFFPNPRGSKGYGRDHCAAIRGDWGGADWEDVQAVTAFMKR
ncbi:MAG: S9 family peptidase, partial [Planctomycetota bacterium]